jgi:hypothetical protein
LERIVLVCHVTEFGWANKREVCWVKEKDRPLALEVGLGDLFEFALVEGLDLEIRDFRID